MRDKEIILYTGRGRPRSLRVTPLRSFLALGILFFCLMGYLFGGAWMLSNAASYVLLRGGQIKADRLETQFAGIRQLSRGLDNDIRALFKNDDLRRRAYGAEVVSAEIRQVGVGGPTSEMDVARYLGLEEAPQYEWLDDKMDKLTRQYEFHSYSSDELESFLVQKMDLMDRIPSLIPAQGTVMSDFGFRVHPILKFRRMHYGVDISNWEGTPVFASAEGRAVSGISESFGHYVLLDHENGYSSLYAHLEKSKVTEGQMIRRGDMIGYMGTSGLSSGPHLHYEVRMRGAAIDPSSFLLPEEYIVD